MPEKQDKKEPEMKTILKVEKLTYVDPVSQYLSNGVRLFFDDGTVISYHGMKASWMKVGEKVERGTWEDRESMVHYVITVEEKKPDSIDQEDIDFDDPRIILDCPIDSTTEGKAIREALALPELREYLALPNRYRVIMKANYIDLSKENRER